MDDEKKKPERYNPTEVFLRAVPPPDGEDAGFWERALEYNEKGRIVSSLKNAYTILSCHEAWKGVLAFDEFSFQVVKRAAPPYERGKAGPWSDEDDHRTMVWMSHHLRVNVDKRTLSQAVDTAAKDNPFHPVKDYLAALKWDGTPRLEHWLHTYLGAVDDEYTRKVGLKFLIGAVARVMRSPCKMDTVLILEGEQGRWKSTALSVLAGAWFMDTPFTIGDKDAFLVIRGSLIVELAELDGFTRAESSRAKAFFSSPTDTFVPKYVAHAIKVPRQCVFAGTVNYGTYLRDTTGNRRYWPVRVQRADIEALRADRDQIWAEAVQRYQEGMRWWVEPDEMDLFSREQDLRYVGDAYEDKIASWLTGRTEATMEQVLSDCLHLETAKWTRAEQTRIGEVMQSLGWEKRRRANGRRGYFYAPREREPGEEG